MVSKSSNDGKLDFEGMSGVLDLLRRYSVWIAPPIIPGVLEHHTRFQSGNDCILAMVKDLLHGRLIVPTLDVERILVRCLVEGLMPDLYSESTLTFGPSY